LCAWEHSKGERERERGKKKGVQKLKRQREEEMVKPFVV
jgi:hypothetical protein